MTDILAEYIAGLIIGLPGIIGILYAAVSLFRK
jgi:hypothetical protein